jgi:hypothetical protein
MAVVAKERKSTYAIEIAEKLHTIEINEHNRNEDITIEDCECL